MSKGTFDFLLSKVGPHLMRRRYSNTTRPAISPAERPVLTLRFLATGNSDFYVLCLLILELEGQQYVILFMIHVLQSEYMKFPSTPDEWTGISRQFWRMWHFPNCLVAIDGKHVAIQAPVNSGSMYYNYKGTHS